MKDYIHLGERSEHKTIATCCVRNLPATYLREQNLNERATSRSGCIPSPGEGKGLGLGLKPLLRARRGWGCCDPQAGGLDLKEEGRGCWNPQAEGLVAQWIQNSLYFTLNPIIRRTSSNVAVALARARSAPSRAMRSSSSLLALNSLMRSRMGAMVFTRSAAICFFKSP